MEPSTHNLQGQAVPHVMPYSLWVSGTSEVCPDQGLTRQGKSCGDTPPPPPPCKIEGLAVLKGKSPVQAPAKLDLVPGRPRQYSRPCCTLAQTGASNSREGFLPLQRMQTTVTRSTPANTFQTREREPDRQAKRYREGAWVVLGMVFMCWLLGLAKDSVVIVCRVLI